MYFEKCFCAQAQRHKAGFINSFCVSTIGGINVTVFIRPNYIWNNVFLPIWTLGFLILYTSWTKYSSIVRISCLNVSWMQNWARAFIFVLFFGFVLRGLTFLFVILVIGCYKFLPPLNHVIYSTYKVIWKKNNSSSKRLVENIFNNTMPF